MFKRRIKMDTEMDRRRIEKIGTAFKKLKI